MKTYLNIDKNYNCLVTNDKMIFNVPVTSNVRAVKIDQFELELEQLTLNSDFIEFFNESGSLFKIELPDQAVADIS